MYLEINVRYTFALKNYRAFLNRLILSQQYIQILNFGLVDHNSDILSKPSQALIELSYSSTTVISSIERKRFFDTALIAPTKTNRLG